MSDSKITVYQVFYIDKERVQKHSMHGFGDYLRGCVCLWELCKTAKHNLQIDFSKHCLSQYLICESKDRKLDYTKDVEYICTDQSKDILQQRLLTATSDVNIFTNWFPGKMQCEDRNYDISSECREFIHLNCLQPRLTFEKQIQNEMLKYHIEPKKYVTIHIRAGDEFLISNCTEMKSDIVRAVVRHMGDVVSKHSNVLLLTDSYGLRCFLQKLFPTIQATGSIPVHLGLTILPHDCVQSTLVDFFLLANSAKIYQISAYKWGSGFSLWASVIFNVPLETLQLKE